MSLADQIEDAQRRLACGHSINDRILFDGCVICLAAEADSLRSRLAEAERDARRWRCAYRMPAGEFLRLVSLAQKGHPGGLNALIDAHLSREQK